MNQDIIDKLNKIMEPYQKIGKMMEPYQRINELMKPMNKMIEASEFITRFQQKIDTSFLDIRKIIEYLNDFHLKSPIFNSPLFEQIKKISSLSERIKEVIEKTPQALLLLAEYGWYIDYDSDFSLPVDLAELIENEQIEKLDEYLIAYYRDKFDTIIEELQHRHPKRKEIISQIASSYKNKNYFVVIPCILAQIDGVANDFTNKKFFLKDKNNNYLPQVTAEITKISESTLESFLSPLTNQTPIIAHESNLNNFPVTLNRHTILHGIDIDYGNEKNCLKCISLLKYLSDILLEIDKE
jgi:hypothetical protein